MDRKQLLERVQSPEDRRFIARVLDKITLILKNHETVVTDFFDPYQQNLISPVLRVPGISFIWAGGTYSRREHFYKSNDIGSWRVI